ncbi:MAG: PEGA domain-containing protein [Candidatus Jettenia sp.]|uniref:PEGA domain-containing protein n=1 Tax=Candidatus Jettenia caeni TaxID=247490 RepID=I3IMH7_9BACT|nr:PEGA domain-containing protein [Candidatus Jettenia sp. AMX1]MBC6928815.1 PEGA domain-containing protein [Candidatus Jettenia sp.]NUN24740.1 PEGA domain-containing protein [Candidatus Jettenia caeni]KAA0250784.1 MAG: PEGA domain-containing protein [Candidatus Jettenia sp. AMX1]MCE7880127.1 PEGA domain-containing protein [Candidatus Jettenia sp. AMX1]MCQ3926909.1 PEGA domain-containing protein [Candidatus Jettenia sp.]
MYGQLFKQITRFVITGLFWCATLCGCVLRSLTVDSNPPGAVVYLDDKPIGETPVTTEFTYYGTRKITLEKTDAEGRLLYERKIAYEKIKAPVYQIFPIDFFFELIIPVKLKDEHYFNYQLDPLKQIPVEELRKEVMRNAEELRDQLQEPTVQ